MFVAPGAPLRRGPIRLVLAAVLVVLVLAGVTLQGIRATPSSSATTATSSTTLDATTTSAAPKAVTSPTIATPRATPVAIARHLKAHGCHLTTTPPHVTASHAPLGRCTVLEIGDSIGADLGWGLSRELAGLPGLSQVMKDKSATGLAAAWYYDWARQLTAMVARHHPDLVVVCMGGDDEQALAINGRSYDFNTPAWRARYASLVRRIDLIATRAGSYVLWIGLPIMQPNLYRAGVVALNGIYQTVSHGVPGVTFLSTWRLFENAQGHYRQGASVNHVAAALRASDGIHFSVVGENVFATYVAEHLAQTYHVHIVPVAPAYITP